MPRKPTHFVISCATNATGVKLFALFLVPALLMSAGCSRKAETPPPAITAADRALPIPVSIPDEQATTPVKGAGSGAQRKIPIEDTQEPVSIDNASIPSSAQGVASPGTKK